MWTLSRIRQAAAARRKVRAIDLRLGFRGHPSPPGLVTRRAAPSATVGLPVYRNELKPVGCPEAQYTSFTMPLSTMTDTIGTPGPFQDINEAVNRESKA
jgi:hypothetical protein